MNGASDPGRGVLILVLGILSILLCQVLGPFAWIMGSGDLKKIAAGQISSEAKPLTQAGMICGIIATILLGLAALFALLWLVLGVGFWTIRQG